VSAATDWFISQDTAPRTAPRIFCFPHAGGSPRAFLGWQDELGADAEILAVCRPGREHRAAEPAPSLGEYVTGAAAAITAVTETDGRPYYLFGHSLGALVAFEVCHALAAAETGPQPRHFVASGCSAPSLMPSQRVLAIAELTGRPFAEAIAFFGGLPPEVLADDDLRELLLPGVIADFRIAVGFRYQRRAPLAVPAALVVGRGDPHVKTPQIAPWQDEFTWPPDQHWVDGGHFYFEPQPTLITGILSSLIQAGEHVELI
jgi:surfactin synthase thioesterase subunit